MTVVRTLQKILARSPQRARVRDARKAKRRDRFVPNLSVTTLENRLLLSASISGLSDPDTVWMLDSPVSEVPEASANTNSAGLSNQAAMLWTDPEAFASEFNDWYLAQDLSSIDDPLSVRLSPSSGIYSGMSIDVPEGIVLVIDGSSGGVQFTGASPALTVTGNVIVQNTTFETSTNDPTIVVRAGATLTLINSVVHESDLFNQSAIMVEAGGMLDLSSGDNLVNVRGDGQLITLQATTNVDIVGNQLAIDGIGLDLTALSNNFEVEDHITHAIDSSSYGLVRWVDQQIFVTQQSGSIARAVAVADSGDTVHIAAGTFIHSGQLDINESISLIGAGQNETIVMRSGVANNTELRTVQINASNVTIESLAFNGWTTLHTNATIGNGYLVWLDTAADHTTFNDVRFHGEDIRVAIYLGTRNDFTITNSVFTGTYFRAAIRGAGERMLISHNRFEESHYWYSPIYMEYGAPTSGDISFNYFVSRVGVNNTSQGLFKSDGTGLYAITNFQPNRTTADGLRIFHNTFHFQDADLVNDLGNRPIAEAIHIDPLLPASGPIEIRDNIFQGYAYTGAQPTGDPLWQPSGGIVDGALEFDGVDDFGWFVDPNLQIGDSGSLSLWVKLDELGRQQTLVHGAMEVQIDASNRIYFYTNKADGSNQSLVSTNPLNNASVQNLVIGQWHHVTITWDLPTKTGRIYLDGLESPTGYRTGFLPFRPSWNNPNPTADRIFYLGSDPSSSSRWLNGVMDDVAFFDTALTAGQVAAITSGGNSGDSVGTSGPSGNLVLHWTLDQSANRVATSEVRGIELNLVPNGVPLGATETALYRDGQGIDFGSGPTGALEFDGLTNYATFSDPGLDIGTNGSMTMWVKLDSFGRQQTLMHGALEVQIDSSRRVYFYANKANSGNVNDTLVRSAALSSSLAGTWVHIAITWDLGNKTGRIYVNGAEIGYSTYQPSKPNWNVPNPTAGEVFFLGNDPTAATWGSGIRFFNGMMDDVALFDSTLTQAQIGLIRSNGVSDTFGPVAHWNFDIDQVNGVYSGTNGTMIPLELYREPPPAPVFAYAVNASANTLVTNNVFYENDINYNPIVNDAGDNLVGDPVFNLLRTVPDPGQPDYQVGFGGMATYASSEHLVDSFTSTPHVGAYQDNPGLFGSGDLIVRGSTADDLLVISDIVRDDLTGLYTAQARYVRGVDGPNEVVLDPIMLVDIAGVLFNGELGDDHFVIIHPVDRVFTPNNGIAFHGGTGGENSAGGNTPGDLLELRQGMADSVSYEIVNALDGFISYDGNVEITYTGVEPMIDTIASEERRFVWQDLDGEVRVIDDPATGVQRIEFDNDQQILFRLPSDSLDMIHVGTADHDIRIVSLDSSYLGNLLIENTGDVRTDSIINIVGGLVITGDNVFLQQAISTGQAVVVAASNALLVNGDVDAGAATITLLVNQDGVGTESLTQTQPTTLSTLNSTISAVVVQVGGSGNFLLSKIETGTSSSVGQVTLDVGGSIVNNLSSDEPNVTTNKFLVIAGTGIAGPIKPLRTDVDFFEADSPQGYIWIIEEDDIQLQGVSATGAIAVGPPQINIQSLAGAISVLNGTWIRSSTGQVNNIPPRLRLDQVDPSDVLLPGDPSQEVTGTIGGIELLGEQLEVGRHFRIVAQWDDGVTSVLDFPTATTVSAAVTGAPSDPVLLAGDTVVWSIDEQNQSTASIVRGPVAEGPIQITIERTYSLLYLQMLRQPEVVASFDLFNDPNIVMRGATQPSLNQSERIVIVTPVAEELLRPSVPVVLVEPPVPVEETKQTTVIVLPPPPPGQTIVYDDSVGTQEEDEDTVSRIYLVRVLPNGQEGERVNLSLAELRNLSGLLDRLKTAPIPNGLYRIYYQEAGLPAQKLLEFRKAGATIGDPVREPGRGSQSLEDEDASQGIQNVDGDESDSALLNKNSNDQRVVLASRFAVNYSGDDSPSYSRVARQVRRWTT